MDRLDLADRRAIVTPRPAKLRFAEQQQHIEPWSKWSTAAQDHARSLFCQLRT